MICYKCAGSKIYALCTLDFVGSVIQKCILLYRQEQVIAKRWLWLKRNEKQILEKYFDIGSYKDALCIRKLNCYSQIVPKIQNSLVIYVGLIQRCVIHREKKLLFIFIHKLCLKFRILSYFIITKMRYILQGEMLFIDKFCKLCLKFRILK